MRTIAPRGKLPTRLRLGFGSRLGLVLGATRQLPPRKIAPRLGLGLGFGGQFSSGAIILEPDMFRGVSNYLKKHLNI